MQPIATFFIVDDEPMLHRVYRDILDAKGHIVCGEAFNGNECITKILESEHDPDFVLLDHRMPEKSGLETMKELLEVKPSLKIIFISADVTLKGEALSAGASIFLKKPFNLKTFFENLDRF